MSCRSLSIIFQRCVSRYRLGGLKLEISQSFGRGVYFRDDGIVGLSSDKVTPEAVVAMLHELAHAIQDREGGLKHYWRDVDTCYSLECAAHRFALREYRRYYQRHYGTPSFRAARLKSKVYYAKNGENLWEGKHNG